MQLRQENRQQQTQKIGPHLIHANLLLQCSNTELVQIIEQEQLENPALDADLHQDGSGTCGHCPNGDFSICAHCPYRRETQSLTDAFSNDDHPESSNVDYSLLRSRDDTDDIQAAQNNEFNLPGFEHDTDVTMGMLGADFDPLLIAAAQTTLASELLQHLRATSKTSAEIVIAEYLVDSLDDRGYLHIDLDEVSLLLNVSREEIEAGVLRLQACDPPGIGARGLQECLLLQMRHLRETKEEKYDELAQKLLEEQWDALTQRRFASLSRRYDVSSERISEALEFIKTRLTPHPATLFRQPWDHRPDRQSMAIRPDVIIIRTPTGFLVEVVGLDNLSLQINSHYRDLYESLRAGSAAQTGQRLSPDHARHVVAYVERAKLFLKNLQRRRVTIQKIANALIESQQGFLHTGQRNFLRPLTRTTIARQLGLHESTISRALLHKYVQLPSEEVVPFDIFFGSATTAKDMIAALIAEEDTMAPLSDQAITQILENRGQQIARRTVVKYREELRIPASYLRRQR